MGRWTWRLAALASLAALIAPGAPAEAETQTVRIAKQFGISYLPLTIMEEEKTLEKHAKALGLDVRTEWIQFTGGAPMNDAIISGSLDLASGGVGPLLTIWGRTRSNLQVNGVAALNAMPLYLNTTDPDVKTVKDFTAKDKIALPAVKISIQAVTLQMAAEKAFGPGQYAKLDPLTVSLGHPDGQAALLSGKSEVNSHFTSAPYQYEELKDPRVHKVLDSYEVLGGHHTFNVVWATTKFHDQNPKVFQAFLAALDEVEKEIAADPAKAAAIYVKAENSKLSAAEVERIIRLPENEWTMVPKKVMAYAEFMHRTGLVAAKPASWQEIFFPELRKFEGS